MDTITQVDLGPQPIERWSDVLEPGAYDEFCRRMAASAEHLAGRRIWNINSTAGGGGVAEMLSALLPYALDAGWDVRWAVMSGDDEFFQVTKGIHNALHGEHPTDDMWERAERIYPETTLRNADDLSSLVSPDDVALVHDPQAAGLIAPLAAAGLNISWQCHIGTDTPNECTRRAWDFLRAYVAPADRYVFTRDDYLWEGLDRERLRVIPPAIDALSAKNAPLTDDQVRAILVAAGVIDGPTGDARFQRSDGAYDDVRRRVKRIGGESRIPADARIVLQVSRWDRLKDPLGFLRMFIDFLADLGDVHLIYAGPSPDGVDDDPESTDVLNACSELWRSLEPGVQCRVHLLSIPMDDIDENAAIVNALQRCADVVVQKSIEEGFGLTVSEAMWKGRPVVAGRVGGIQDQIENDRSGILVDDPYDVAAFARAVRILLEDPQRSTRLGERARQRVRERFLGPRQLGQYADLMTELVG